MQFQHCVANNEHQIRQELMKNENSSLSYFGKLRHIEYDAKMNAIVSHHIVEHIINIMEENFIIY